MYTPSGVNYVDDPPGTEMQRTTTGMGEFVTDPMQSLNQAVTVDSHSKVTKLKEHDSLPTASIRQKGVAAYRKVK